MLSAPEIWMAMTLGSIRGMLRDPLTIAFLLLCIVLGGFRARWYWLALAIEVIVVANLLWAGSRLLAAGIDPIARIPWWLQNWTILAVSGYAAGMALPQIGRWLKNDSRVA